MAGVKDELGIQVYNLSIHTAFKPSEADPERSMGLIEPHF
jgi:hypothetical protein